MNCIEYIFDCTITRPIWRPKDNSVPPRVYQMQYELMFVDIKIIHGEDETPVGKVYVQIVNEIRHEAVKPPQICPSLSELRQLNTKGAPL